jgi:hypothetical protein
MTNSLREQKNNKVIVHTILVNRKKIIVQAQVIEWFFGMFFIFLEFLKFYYKGHFDVARLTSFHHKENL